MTFRQKLVGITITLGLIIAIALTSFMTVENKRVLINSILEGNEAIAMAIAINIDNYLDELAKTTETLATSPIIRAGLTESNRRRGALSEAKRAEELSELDQRWINSADDDPFVRSYLSNPLADHLKRQEQVIPDLYGEIFLTDKYGGLVASTTKLTTFFHGAKYWWSAAYNDSAGQVFFDDRGYDLSVDDFVLGVTVPVYENGQTLGVLKSNMRIFNLFSTVIKDYLPLYKPGKVKIVRTDGGVVLEPDQPPLSTRVSERLLPILGRESTSQILEDVDGEGLLVSVSPIKNTTEMGRFRFGGSEESLDHSLGNAQESWVVLLEVPRTIVDQRVAKQTRQFLLVGFLSVAIASLFTLFFVNRATQNIVALVDLTDEVGQGNLEKHIAVSSTDEIGRLADSFNTMVDRLRETMASKEDLTDEINRRIETEKQLQHLSTVDELTQTYNRRAFNGFLTRLIAASRSRGTPLSLAMLDIDWFKKINDTYGHSVGDAVLTELAELLKSNIREEDILSRWGGEEFIILMPKLSGVAARKMAERLRVAVKNAVFIRNIAITVSIGVTELRDNDSFDQLIRRVDDAQYQAKSSGRDAVQML